MEGGLIRYQYEDVVVSMAVTAIIFMGDIQERCIDKLDGRILNRVAGRGSGKWGI